jgi:hypothetical protein
MGKGEVTSPQWRDKCKERYGFDPLEATKETGKLRTGEDMVFEVADTVCRGNAEDASRKIMQDFRAGRMGPICLQLAPSSETWANAWDRCGAKQWMDSGGRGYQCSQTTVSFAQVLAQNVFAPVVASNSVFSDTSEN